MQPTGSIVVAQLAVAVALAIAGGWVIVKIRSGSAPVRVLITPIGDVSPITMLLTGLAFLGIAYHLAVHALGAAAIVAPMPVAMVAAAVVVGGSLLVDWVENNQRDDSGR